MARSNVWKSGKNVERGYNVFIGTKDVGKKKVLMKPEEFNKMTDDEKKRYLGLAAKAADKQKNKMKAYEGARGAIAHYQNLMEQAGINKGANWNTGINKASSNQLMERYRIIYAYQTKSKTYNAKGAKQAEENLIQSMMNASGKKDRKIGNLTREQAEVLQDYFAAMRGMKESLAYQIDGKILDMETMKTITDILNEKVGNFTDSGYKVNVDNKVVQLTALTYEQQEVFYKAFGLSTRINYSDEFLRSKGIEV